MKYAMLTAALVFAATANSVFAVDYCQKGAGACNGYGYYPWHGYYYDVGWGGPVALVIPPTAEVQTHWGWGVGNYRITPNCPQFQPEWPGAGRWGAKGFQPTPAQPTDTDQFGDYYVRGPW